MRSTSTGHRLDLGDTELNSLLYGQIHFVSGLQRLHQCDSQRRLPLHILPGNDIGLNGILAHRGDTRLVLAALAIEQRHLRVRPKTEYPRGMSGGTFRQHYAGADGERFRAKKAGRYHHVIIGK